MSHAAKEHAKEGLKIAIDRAGGVRRLARKLGITHGAIGYWDTVPLDWVERIEQELNIPRHELRPDFFMNYRFIETKHHRRSRK